METQTNNAPPKLVVRRVIHAKRDRVFAAWSKPELMCQWFFPGTGKAIVTNDFRLGGNYRNEMLVKPAGDGCHGQPASEEELNSYVHTGKYLEITPPEKLVFTWNSPCAGDYSFHQRKVANS